MTIDNNAYDAVPYESFPYDKTDPVSLYSIAKLFSVNAVKYENCKVLELGCASGGNIIAMAAKSPNSKFVGIDLSKVQIEKGNKEIEGLELKNIKLEQKSILDINEDFGKFDYIIAHGILSWVPENVQNKIFEICQNNLSENGLAYISYNTLPGWNMVKTIRDMMLYHTKDIENPAEKVAQSKILLKFIEDARNNPEDPYVKILQAEREKLNTVNDTYLLHDHLEEVNKQFYFTEFSDKALEHGLSYLADADIATMFLGNMAESVNSKLSEIKDDIVKVEQYMDFINNRRFRMTILCKSGTAINRNLSQDSIKDFYFTPNFTVDEKDLEPKEDGLVKVAINKAGSLFSTRSKVFIEVLRIFAQSNGLSFSCDDLAKSVQDVLGDKVSIELIKNDILTNMLRLILAGCIQFRDKRFMNVIQVSKKPEASKLSRFQSGLEKNWVTSQKSRIVSIDSFDKIILQYLDGNNDLGTIISKMVAHVEKNEIKLQKDGKAVEDKKEIATLVKELTDNKLKLYAQNGLLVA